MSYLQTTFEKLHIAVDRHFLAKTSQQNILRLDPKGILESPKDTVALVSSPDPTLSQGRMVC